jgi:16S rRNA pseudouridine516 synthase
MQLERLLQSQGFGTRRECRALVRSGGVEVDGRACDDPFVEVDAASVTFRVRGGEAWRYRAKAYVLLNKPAGYECSRSPRHHPSVLSLLPVPLRTRGVQPVGRLDEDTTGLLLLSDDGSFIHALTSPRRKVEKIYEVRCKHPVDAAQITTLLGGVVLHDDPAPVVASSCEQASERVVRLGIDEGRYHQVKRMLAAVHNRVETLRRIRIGGLALPADLAEGQWRWLEAADLAALGLPNGFPSTPDESGRQSGARCGAG